VLGIDVGSATWSLNGRDCATTMKVYSYIVAYDSGFAPNPFHGICTLACCKPTIRRTAHEKE